MLCRSVHVRGFTAGQKTVENQDWAAEPPGRRAVAGRGPRAAGRGPRAAGRQAVGPSGRQAAGPWRAVGRGPAFSKTRTEEYLF